jgi:2,3-dihydroxybenzoate-AMP ligase
VLDGVTPFPAEVAERYRREGYWRGDTLGDLLRRWAAQHGDRTALVDGERRLSYADLDTLADRLAYRLLQRGLGRGDRVVLHLSNVPEFVVVAFALFRIGALPVFALPDHREHELDHFVRFAEAVGYVIPTSYRGFDEQALARKLRDAHPSLAHVLVVGDDVADDLTPLGALLDDPVDADEARAAVDAHRPDPGDVALFLLSGGTTGLPKFIPRTHDDYAYNVRASAELCGFDPDTVYLVALPIAHNFPWGCPGLLGALHAGGRAVLTGNPNPDAAFPLIEAEGVTATALVPALAIRWMDAVADADADGDGGHDLSSLRLLQVGGARLNPEAARRVAPTLGCTLQQVFGMAEGLLNYTRLDDPEEVLVETQGRPLSPADEVRIVDDDDRPVPAGEPGRLLTRGPYTIRGYYHAPEENAESFTPDGFYRTGDVVRWHPSGNLSVEGRVKDFINRGGEKISAEEVENHVLAHPAVANVAAVAMPDREMNERTCAYVVLHPGAVLTLNGLAEFLRDRGLARFKVPDRLELVDELPLTNVGKVSKRTLREDIAGKLADEGARSPGAGAPQEGPRRWSDGDEDRRRGAVPDRHRAR